MRVEVVRSRACEFDWLVGAVNEEGEGEIYLATFSGPLAEERAREYAHWKYPSTGSLAEAS